MSEPTRPDNDVEPIVSEEALKKAEEFIEEEEGAANKLSGWLAAFVTFSAVAMSAFHLYTAYGLLATQTLRPVHVAWVLFIGFLVFPVAKRFRHRIMWWDWILALLSVAVAVYLIQGGDDLNDRNTYPNNWDIFFGVALMLMVMEVMRRTNGWIMAAITGAL